MAFTDDEITLCGHPGCDEAGTLTDRHGAACPAHVDRDTEVDQVAAGLLPDHHFTLCTEDCDDPSTACALCPKQDELGRDLVELGAAVLEEVHAEMHTPQGQQRTAELLARLGLSDAPDFVPGGE
jgi:hypothetical protein